MKYYLTYIPGSTIILQLFQNPTVIMVPWYLSVTLGGTTVSAHSFSALRTEWLDELERCMSGKCETVLVFSTGLAKTICIVSYLHRTFKQ